MKTIEIKVPTEVTHELELPFYFRFSNDFYAILDNDLAFKAERYSHAQKSATIAKLDIETAKIVAAKGVRVTRNEFMKFAQDCRAEFMATYTELMEEDNNITANLYEHEEHDGWDDNEPPIDETFPEETFPEFTENH